MTMAADFARSSLDAFRRHGAVLSVSLACLLAVSAPANAQSSPTKGKLGFVFTSWNYGNYTTKFWDECPDGVSASNDELWLESLPKGARPRATNNGLLEPYSRFKTAQARGPKGEDVCWNPTAVKDPPQRLAQGKISYGLNLDGTDDGHATARTCAHEKWAVSPDGDETRIDNQMYRVTGCTNGMRGNGPFETYDDQERRSSGRGLILVEVTGVDDPRNDNDIQVAFYRALDQMPRDTAGNILPNSSYRIDVDNQGVVRYGDTAHGKIVNGVLTTDPADVILPYYGNEGWLKMTFRGMRLRLNIAPDGKTAKGVVAGYYDLDRWWDSIRNTEYTVSMVDNNCPGLYEAAHRLADGYPDPVTGKCTAISSAFIVDATSAFVIHPSGTQKMSEALPTIQTAQRDR